MCIKLAVWLLRPQANASDTHALGRSVIAVSSQHHLNRS